MDAAERQDRKSQPHELWRETLLAAALLTARDAPGCLPDFLFRADKDETIRPSPRAS